MEQTLVILKPDCVRRRLCGEILTRFERKGLRLIAMKLIRASVELAGEHYEAHKDRPFFNSLVSFLASGPLVAVILEGQDAINITRALIGNQSAPGTIRGDYVSDVQENIVHGSDSPDGAHREISLWFKDVI